MKNLLKCLFALTTFCCAISQLLHAQLLIVSTADFDTPGAWSIDIDGDGVDELSPRPVFSNESDMFLDRTIGPSDFVGTSERMLVNSFKDATAFDGTFTATSDTSIWHDNTSGHTALTGYAFLALGTDTSNLVNAVSLVGFVLEAPTTGSDVGWFSGVNHNDDVYVYYRDFGDIGAGQSAVLDYSGSLAVSAVPEPSTYAFTVGAVVLAGTCGVRRRRRVSAPASVVSPASRA